jgi:hypothetical protein
MLADKALVALTALKRLESESGLKAREETRGEVPRRGKFGRNMTTP